MKNTGLIQLLLGYFFILGKLLLVQEGYSQGIPVAFKEVGITEHLGEQLPIQELRFRDEAGKEIFLSHYFQKDHPVLIALIYYECPNICNFLLNGLIETLQDLSWVPGREFNLVMVSIDPREKPELAEKKKKAYLAAYGKPETHAGWHFLTGQEDQIRSLASRLGFAYHYDEKSKQFAHRAALFALTSEGKISRYLYGTQFSLQDLRLALLEASHGKMGTMIDRIIQWDRLYFFSICLSVFLFVLVLGGMIYFVIRYRNQPGFRPKHITEHYLLEAVWIVVPTALLMIIFVWGYWLYYKMV